MKRFLQLFLILPLLLWVACEESGDTSPELTEDCAGVEGGENICGCTDSTATNYDNIATYEDGSCEYYFDEGRVPNLNNDFDRNLFNTFISYIPTDKRLLKTELDILGGDNNTSKGILLPILQLLIDIEQ